MSENILNDISKVYLEQIAVDEAVRGQDSEMRKAASQERQKERKERGGAAPKIPGREGPSVGKTYADYQKMSIKGHDKATKGKHIAGYAYSESLDPVGKEDKDIDNDGDHDKSDKYLMKRRKAIGKAIATRKESFSNWRQDLSEVMDDAEGEKKIKEKKVENKIVINPDLKEAVEELGGTLLEMVEIGEEKKEECPKCKGKGCKYCCDDEEIEEAYKPIDKKKETAMYRRAGNLARTSLSSKGKKKEDAQNKSAKIVSAISRQKENERFSKMADEKARSNYKEELELDERYKGKHGQSSSEYKDDRSPGGKMVSGDSKQSGAEYTHGRRVKAANPGSQPDEGGKTKPKSQGKMDAGTRADLAYRKANLKKEEVIAEEDPCWDTHKQVGMKKKGGKMVPNCVPKEEVFAEVVNTPTPDYNKAKQLNSPASPTGGQRPPKSLDPRNKPGIDSLTGLKLAHYQPEGEQIEEKAMSRAQQRFMGMVYAAKKGEKPASAEVAKAAAGISKGEAKKFAKTKHKGLPEKKKISEQIGIDASKTPQKTPEKLLQKLAPNYGGGTVVKSSATLQKAHFEPEGEQLDEMPYQVMGSTDGKKEKKVGKPVKSKKYADARAAELADTHKATGGKYRSQYVESAEDRARDEHQMRGGMAARVDYDRPPAKKLSNKELGIGEFSAKEKAKRLEQMRAHLKKMGRS